MDTQILATQIIKTLVNAGHTAYFAGGWVRDYIMGHPSDDIDIATDAPPEKILDLFPNTVHVGLAFGVVIVSLEGHQFEVATFRSDVGSADGRRPLAIKPAIAHEDAQRRDFTINGLFYDPLSSTIHDYVQGKEDITRGIIRCIGDPYDRFFEDRLRMIRAIRFAARFHFAIDQETEEAITGTAHLLFPAVSMERIWQEFNKMAASPHLDRALTDMHRLRLLSVIFPELSETSLHDIKQRIAAFPHFPKNAPTIAYLLELFPHTPKEKIEELCRYLKTSNLDLAFARLLTSAKELVVREEKNHPPPESVEWSHFYAKENAQMTLEIIAASYYPERERGSFLQKHNYRQQELAKHIRRIREKQPLVNAETLKKLGIPPKKQMGVLLREAERIAINRDLHNTEQVIELLKTSSLWPEL